MSLSNEQLLNLSALAYYNIDNINTGSKNVKEIIKEIKDDEMITCFDGKVVISCKGVEWICKNVFKQNYLELLEKKKMELTEKYIKAGYIYDHFFHRN